jgi:hypothetical protein
MDDTCPDMTGSLCAVGSVLLAVAAWWAYSEYGRFSNPSGSAFPLGLPLAVVAGAGSTILYAVAVRTRRVPLIVAGAFGPLLVLGLIAAAAGAIGG